MYSYLDNVFPDFENTSDTLYSKLYSSTNVSKIYNQNPFKKDPNTNSFLPQSHENFESIPHKFQSNEYSQKGKSNILVDVTEPYFKVPENEVGGYYNRVAVPNPQTPQLHQSQQLHEGFESPNVCDDYIYHVMNCPSCRRTVGDKLNVNSGMFELISYIVFGVLLLLLMEKL
jgi:hypothetical protein